MDRQLVGLTGRTEDRQTVSQVDDESESKIDRQEDGWTVRMSEWTDGHLSHTCLTLFHY